MPTGGGDRARASRAAAGVAAAVTAAFLACSGPVREQDRTLRIVVGGTPVTLDPQRHAEDLTRALLGNFYEGLVDFDGDLAIRPRLALTWSNPSETVWRFRLRPGVVFQDGSPFGPEDVARTIRRGRTIPDSRMEADVRSVVEVRVVDATTVELVTDRPRPLLLAKLAQTPILSRSVPDAEIDHPIGTGPYRYLKPVPGSGVTLSGLRFERYWGTRPAFSRFEAVPALDDEALLREARLGADVVTPFPVPTDGAAAPSGFRSIRQPTLAASLLVCRLTPLAGGAPSPFQDVRVRRAIDLALDRDQIVRAGLGGEGRPLRQLVPRGIFGFDPLASSRGPDPAEARRLLAEAGAGQGIESVLSVSPRGRAVGAEIARQLADVGIRLTVDVTPWAELYLRMRRGEVPLALASWGFATGDASSLYEPVLHSRGGAEGLGAENTSGYANAAVDDAIEKAAQEMQATLRNDLLARVGKQALEDLPLIPLYSPDWSYGVRSGLAFSPRLDLAVFAADIRPAAPPR